MYYEKTDTRAQARNSNLNEELGQVISIELHKTKLYVVIVTWFDVILYVHCVVGIILTYTHLQLLIYPLGKVCPYQLLPVI